MYVYYISYYLPLKGGVVLNWKSLDLLLTLSQVYIKVVQWF